MQQIYFYFRNKNTTKQNANTKLRCVFFKPGIISLAYEGILDTPSSLQSTTYHSPPKLVQPTQPHISKPHRSWAVIKTHQWHSVILVGNRDPYTGLW